MGAKEKNPAAEAYAAERREWAAEHGSRRLKRCIEEGIECDGIYRDERLAMAHPGAAYCKGLPGAADEPRNPPQTAADLLDKARQTAPEAKLRYWVINRDELAEALGQDKLQRLDLEAWRGYVAVAEFLGRGIAFLPEDWPKPEASAEG